MSTVRRTRALRLAAGVVAAGLAVALPAGAAFAGTGEGRIDHVQTASNGTTDVLFSIPGLPQSVSPDASTVTVTVNGQRVTASATRATQSGQAIRRTAVLAMDVSNSMRSSFAAEKQAALAFIKAAPADVYVGMVTFASKVTVVSPPTLDRAKLEQAVGGVKLSLQTQLYAGVEQAVKLAGTTGASSVLLLSDGKDTTKTPLSGLLSTLHKSGTRIDAVSLHQQLTSSSPLVQIVKATKGTLTQTGSSADLQKLFAGEAAVLAKQLLVTFKVPAKDAGSQGTLQVSVNAGGSTYADHAFVSFSNVVLPKAGPTYQAVTPSGPRVTGSEMALGVLLLFVGVAALLAYGFSKMRPAELTPLQQQMKLYTVHGLRRTQEGLVNAEGFDIKKSALRLTDKLMTRRDLEERLQKKLESGGVQFTPSEWLLTHAGIAIGAGIIGLLITGFNPLGMVILFALGVALPWFWLSHKQSKRKKDFNGQLAETLQLMAGGLSAGLSLPQAVDTVVRQGTDPISTEFNKALVEQRLGINVEDALDGVADRMGSKDFKWVVMAIRIQREVGGNLAELLNIVAATLREREYLRRQVKTLSAEGRLSAWIIGLLPPLFFAYLLMARPDYLAPMTHSTLGWVMIGMAVVLMAIGIFGLKKAVKVEV